MNVPLWYCTPSTVRLYEYGKERSSILWKGGSFAETYVVPVPVVLYVVHEVPEHSLYDILKFGES